MWEGTSWSKVGLVKTHPSCYFTLKYQVLAKKFVPSWDFLNITWPFWFIYTQDKANHDEENVPSSEDEAPGLLDILGEDLLLDDLDAVLPFLTILFPEESEAELLGGWGFPLFISLTGVITSAALLGLGVKFASFCKKILGIGESELVGVCVLDAFLDDFLVNGDCNILCFHSKSLFIDSSLCSRLLLSSGAKSSGWFLLFPVSYTHLTLPTIYSV